MKGPYRKASTIRLTKAERAKQKRQARKARRKRAARQLLKRRGKR